VEGHFSKEDAADSRYPAFFAVEIPTGGLVRDVGISKSSESVPLKVA